MLSEGQAELFKSWDYDGRMGGGWRDERERRESPKLEKG